VARIRQQGHHDEGWHSPRISRGHRPLRLRRQLEDPLHQEGSPPRTGRQKLIDTEGRVDRFTKKFGAQTVEARKAAAKEAKAKKAASKPS